MMLGAVLMASALVTACGTTVPASKRSAAPAAGVAPDGAASLTGGAATPESAVSEQTSSAGTVANSTRGRTNATPPAASGAAGTARGPISVGFLVSDYTKTAAAFGITGPPSDPQSGFKGLVANANKHGGFGGRQIKPVYFTFDASSADWNAEDQTACSTFTEDNHVEVVVSENWNHETLAGCLLNAGIPQIDGSISPYNDRKGLAKYPNVFVPNGIETDRSVAALIDSSVKAGWLGPKDKLGVAADTCPWDVRTANEVLPAKARQYGFKLDVAATASCGVGFQDVGSFTAGMQNAAFRLHADGANKILILTQGANGGLAFFATGADSQGWHPDYLIDSEAFPSDTANGGTIPAGQLPNMRGLGWVPITDVANAQPTDTARKCLATSIEGGAETPSTVFTTATRYSACTAFWVAAAAFDKTQGRAGIATVRAAVEQLANAVTSPLTFGGAMQLDAAHHTGAAMANRFQYNQGCSCFQYVGSPEPLP